MQLQCLGSALKHQGSEGAQGGLSQWGGRKVGLELAMAGSSLN